MSPLVKTCIGVKDEPCTTLIPIGQKRCARHALKHKQHDYPRRARTRRRTPQRQVYNDPRWRTCRHQVLTRDPICVLCHANPATVADHYPTPLSELLTTGRDPFDMNAARGLCAACSGHHDGPRSRTNQRTRA